MDSFEISSFDTINLQTSFEPKVVPGAKLSFASSRTGGGNLGVVYKHNFATITAGLDVGNFNSLQSSIVSGGKGFNVGAAVDFSLKNKDINDYSTALAWAPKEGLFAGVQANDKFANVATSLQYQASPKLNVAASVEFAPKAISESLKVAIGSEYVYRPDVSLKVKTNNDGIVNASIKKTMEKYTINAAVEINSKDLSSFNFGINTTIG